MVVKSYISAPDKNLYINVWFVSGRGMMMCDVSVYRCVVALGVWVYVMLWLLLVVILV